jgi:hypothetical protein
VAHFISGTGLVHWIPTSRPLYERSTDYEAVVGDGGTIEVLDASGAIQQVVTGLPMPDDRMWRYWSSGQYTATVNGGAVLMHLPAVAVSASTSQTY